MSELRIKYSRTTLLVIVLVLLAMVAEGIIIHRYDQRRLTTEQLRQAAYDQGVRDGQALGHAKPVK